MDKITKHFRTIGQAILKGGATAKDASHMGVKHLRSESPAPEWAAIPVERDAFVQYEPSTRTLRASLHDIALYRYVTQRSR